MKRIYFLFIILFLTALACEAQDTRGLVLTEWDNPELVEIATDQRLYERVNEIRKQHGLKPLSRSSVLELKSGRWLKKMHVKYYGLVHDRASKEAELLTDCRDPLTCWMRSKAHRKILLSKDYTKIGIVLVEGDWCARLD